MKLFGLEIKKQDKVPPKTVVRNCYGCGTRIYVQSEKLRVTNYCNHCSPRIV